MLMDLGTRKTLLYDSMYYITAVSLEMSDEPSINVNKERGHAIKTYPLRIIIIVL